MAPGMTPRQGLAATTAHLGRAPQDALEATIVLEAWVGVRPETAMDLGSRIMAHTAGDPDAAVRRSVTARPAPGFRTQGTALLVLLVAIALWARPLIDWVGGAGFELAWKTGLPLVLALQWIVQARFVEGDRLAQLRRHVVSICALLIGATAVIVLVPNAVPATAVGLALPWLGAVVLAERRGWLVLHVTAVLGVSAAMVQGVDPRAVLGVLAAVTSASILAALWRTPESSLQPHPLGTSLLAGLVGAGIGGVLVLGAPAQTLDESPLLAVLMIPSVIGGLWGSARLRGLWYAIPQSLRTVQVLGAGRVKRSPAVAVVVGAMWRYVAATVLLSVALLVATAPSSRTWTALALGYGLMGLAGLLAAIAWSYGYRLWTCGSMLGGVLVVLLLQTTVPETDAALSVGALTVNALLARPLFAALHLVEQSFATRLQIP